eukprot:TRINITY_DN5317_c0_g1_i1.p1 TRINITY_DN5317_c0_g1~~TRINITY_DN5317_c0_g1_i1.p1  ORF type:complete len:1070 (-),score=409.82 TRINITY_DN5317_c0_g1_i1:87-3296(-)
MEEKDIKKVIWIPDKDVAKCEQCDTKFTLTKRRHHCRACGHIFCSNCTKIKMVLTPEYGYTSPQKVCDSCFLLMGQISNEEKGAIDEVVNEIREEIIFSASVIVESSTVKKIKISQHVAIVGRYRIILFHNKKISQNIHFYDLNHVIIGRESISLRFNEDEEIRIKSPSPMELAKGLKNSYNRITIGFPQEKLCEMRVEGMDNKIPELPLDESLLMAGGFIETYKAYCNYYNCYASPSLMQQIFDCWDDESLVLDLSETPGIENDSGVTLDLQPLSCALYYNNYFRALRVSDVSRKGFLTLFCSVFKHNTYLTEIEISNMTHSSGKTLAILGQSLKSNTLNNLQSISLSGTRLQEVSMIELASALRSFTHGLKKLDLSNCQLTSKLVTILMMEGLSANYQLSASIEELNLSGNKFGEQGSVSFALWLQAMQDETNLKELNLSNSGILAGIIIKTLVIVHKQLENIDLSFNKIEVSDCGALISLAKITRTIKRYNIAGTSMSGEQIAYFMRAVLTNENLNESWINISSLNLNDNDALLIKAALSEKNNNIKGLDVSQNRFKDTGLINLFQALFQSKLDTLIISGCLAPKSITSEVVGKRIATSLSSLLKSCPTIKTLKMNKSYDGRVILPLLENLAQNSSLLELDISENKLSDLGGTILAMFLRLNNTLRSITIDNNSIGLSGYQALHTTFKRGLNKSLYFFEFPWGDYIRLNSTVDTQSTALVGLHKKLRPVKQKQLQEVLLEIQLQIAKNRPNKENQLPERLRQKEKPILTNIHHFANISDRLLKCNSQVVNNERVVPPELKTIIGTFGTFDEEITPLLVSPPPQRLNQSSGDVDVSSPNEVLSPRNSSSNKHYTMPPKSTPPNLGDSGEIPKPPPRPQNNTNPPPTNNDVPQVPSRSNKNPPVLTPTISDPNLLVNIPPPLFSNDIPPPPPSNENYNNTNIENNFPEGNVPPPPPPPIFENNTPSRPKSTNDAFNSGGNASPLPEIDDERGSLLSSIQNFSKKGLKKSVTVDKSEPMTSAKQNDFSENNGGGGLGGGVLSDLFNIISQRRVAIKHDSESEDSIENEF